MATGSLKNTFAQAAVDVRRGMNLIATREGIGQLINWWPHAMLAGSLAQSVQYANGSSSSLALTAIGLAGAAAGYYIRGRASRPESP